MSPFIGVIIGDSGRVYAVINPDDDGELDNPQFLLMRGGPAEPMRMVRVPREQFLGAYTMEEIQRLVERAEDAASR